MSDRITLALPSKGAIAEPTYAFLKACGLKVSQPNPRQYTGNIAGLPQVDVLFQRVKDVVYKVADGTVELGITGLDVVHENNSDSITILHNKLGYGHCKLVVAVPESWVDVESIADLADVAIDFRENKGRNLRVATTFTNSARQYLHEVGIHHFTLVRSEGAIEAAPTLGYADVIVDLVQTGTTLRENRLKAIPDAVILESQACLIGNTSALKNPQVLSTIRIILEYADATIKAKNYHQINVNIRGKDAQEIAHKVASNPITQGLKGPTIAPIYSASGDEIENGNWHTITITTKNDNLLDAVDFLRSIGGTQVIVSPVSFVFLQESPTYQQLLTKLNHRG